MDDLRHPLATRAALASVVAAVLAACWLWMPVLGLVVTIAVALVVGWSLAPARWQYRLKGR